MQTKAPPKAYFMAALSSVSYPTSSSAGCALPPAMRCAVATAAGGRSREDTCIALDGKEKGERLRFAVGAGGHM